MVVETTLTSFIDDLASAAPVPGGGGAAPIVGALSGALAEMDANLTSGKKRYAEVQPEIDEILKTTAKLRQEFVELADADAVAFLPVSKAYGMPRTTEEEIKKRDEVMQKGLEGAVVPPLRTMELCLEILKIQKRLAEIGSRLAVSDAGVGSEFARAALRSSSLNVYVNTRLMKDRKKAEELNRKADEYVEAGAALADETYKTVSAALAYKG